MPPVEAHAQLAFHFKPWAAQFVTKGLSSGLGCHASVTPASQWLLQTLVPTHFCTAAQTASCDASINSHS